MLDFDGDSRRMSYTRHAGYVAVCGCGRTMQPEFPGLPGTFFGDGPAAAHFGVLYTPQHGFGRLLLF